MQKIAINHLPLRLYLGIWSNDYCYLRFSAFDEPTFMLEEYFLNGLPPDLVYFVVVHCECAQCGASISRLLSPCECGKPEREPYFLEVRYPTALYRTKFSPIFEREQRRIANRKRRKRIAENGGSHSPQDIAMLHHLQEGICYFCGIDITPSGAGAPANIDHYDPVFNGGRDDLSNLVLTCRPCNRKKGTMNGDDFEQIARRLREPAIGKRLGPMRRALNAFRRKSFRTLRGN